MARRSCLGVAVAAVGGVARRLGYSAPAVHAVGSRRSGQLARTGGSDLACNRTAAKPLRRSQGAGGALGRAAALLFIIASRQLKPNLPIDAVIWAICLSEWVRALSA